MVDYFGPREKHHKMSNLQAYKSLNIREHLSNFPESILKLLHLLPKQHWWFKAWRRGDLEKGGKQGMRGGSSRTRKKKQKKKVEMKQFLAFQCLFYFESPLFSAENHIAYSIFSGWRKDLIDAFCRQACFPSILVKGKNGSQCRKVSTNPTVLCAYVYDSHVSTDSL